MNEKKTKNSYSWPVWADLPEELLVKIGKCLKYSFQVGHFRAVCTSWRCAVPPPPHKRLSIIPKYFCSKQRNRNGKYMRRLVLRLDLQQMPPSSSSSSSSSSSPTSYLIAVGEQFDSDGQSLLRLLNPVTGSPIPISSIPSNLFPREIDLNKFCISILHKSSLIWHGDTNHVHTGKAVHLSAPSHSSSGGTDLLEATAVLGSGKLYMFTSNTRGLVILNNIMDSLHRDHNLPDKPVYHDVVKYKKKWFAIDQYGRGVMVDSSSQVSLVTKPLFVPHWNGYLHNHKSYLVKSPGDADLFLVDRYLVKSSRQTKQHAVTSDEDTKEPVYHMAVKFRVYRLDEEKQCWKEVTSLNDQVIFVGDDASFWSYCVSAKDFPGCRGNLIYFTDQFSKLDCFKLPSYGDLI